MATEGLGQNLKSSLDQHQFKGIRLHPFVDPLSHLQFMDDTMLMGAPTVQEAKVFKAILETFMIASGALINQDKSQIFFLNTPLRVQRNTTRLLGFQRSSLPSNYLGDPLLENSIRNISSESLLPKLEN
jgi:hypothetical protein